jgi:hypothetical protein
MLPEIALRRIPTAFRTPRSVASGAVQGRHSIRPGIEGGPLASAFYATDRAKGAEAKKAVAELQMKDPAAPADEFTRIACEGPALEIEAEPPEEAAERIRGGCGRVHRAQRGSGGFRVNSPSS